jgi:hypothetical protein
MIVRVYSMYMCRIGISPECRKLTVKLDNLAESSRYLGDLAEGGRYLGDMAWTWCNPEDLGKPKKI